MKRNNNIDNDIVALGELLVDMLPAGVSERGNAEYEFNPGGAPCNVISMASSLGSKCSFIGKVGDDVFGHRLAQLISEVGIQTDGVVFDGRYPTTMAFLNLDSETGDRSFTFIRKPGADTMLDWDEVNIELIDSAKIFHFGTLSLSDEPSRSTTEKAVLYAKSKNKLISFDPNVRPLLWSDHDELLERCKYGLANADIVKLSGEELELLYRDTDFNDAINLLSQQFPNIKLLLVTFGKDGCFFKFGTYSKHLPAYTAGKTIDTTGAGDCFLGVCLSEIAKRGLENISTEDMNEIVNEASAAAAILITRYGSLRAMPSEEDINKVVQNVRNTAN